MGCKHIKKPNFSFAFIYKIKNKKEHTQINRGKKSGIYRRERDAL